MTSGLSAMSRDRTAAKSSSTTRMYVNPLGGASDVGAWAAPRFHTSNPIPSPVIPAKPNVIVRRRMVILYVAGDTSVPGTLTVIAGVFDGRAHVRGTERGRFEQESEGPLGHAKACGPRSPEAPSTSRVGSPEPSAGLLESSAGSPESSAGSPESS